MVIYVYLIVLKYTKKSYNLMDPIVKYHQVFF